jgi:hypothetical protein
MPDAATGLTPLIERGATKEQLAAPTVLLGGNRPRSREPPKRVPVETQVLRRPAGVKPLVSAIGAVVLEARNDCRRHTVDEAVDQQVDYRAVATAGVTESARHPLVSEHRFCRTHGGFALRPIGSNLAPRSSEPNPGRTVSTAGESRFHVADRLPANALVANTGLARTYA